MAELSPDDLPPVPPVRPSNDDCCRGACDPCIFDVYEDALERYRAELQAWQERKRRRERTEIAPPLVEQADQPAA